MPITRTSLLLRLRSGADQTGWSEFVQLYEPLLETSVRRAFIPEQDVPDVVQNILLRLIRVLPRFEYDPDRGRFRAWLGTVCRAVIVDWQRNHPRTVTLPPSLATVVASVEPDSAWELEHRRHVLRHATAAVQSQVPARAWLCFERYVLYGQTAESVAAALQLTPAAVYVITSRIRARLRRKCAQFDEDFT